MKTVAVIPCYNESKHIVQVVTETKKYVDTVIVVDGGSTDNTRDIADKAGAIAIENNINGYGSNVIRGINYAVDYQEADVIVLLDGDGQHDPADIPALLEPIHYSGMRSVKADIVMGCRGMNKEMPLYRQIGNKILTFICNTGAEFKPPDAMTGFWAINTKALPELTELGWGMATELLIKTRTDGRQITTRAVRTIYHDKYEDNSSSSPIWLGLMLVWYILKWRWKVEVLR